jgi:hypothetical protein
MMSRPETTGISFCIRKDATSLPGRRAFAVLRTCPRSSSHLQVQKLAIHSTVKNPNQISQVALDSAMNRGELVSRD